MSVLPVFIALIFNLMAPVLSIAAPDGAPGPLSAPEAAIAVSDIDPAHVNFTLEGCKDPSVNLELTDFVCADEDYTSGNLGKSWNELDLVPHRLTTTLGSQAAATTTYDVAIVADHEEAGAAGYDIISVPVINEELSDDSCMVEATGGPVGLEADPGIGGTDISLYRIVTITQDKGTTCVFDYYERLALGSHLFSGSSLHSNLTNKDLGTQGVGARDVSIPVKEIEPQEISKEMSATQGQAYGWSVEKSADPTSLHFANTCLDTDGARSAQVEITIEWTRSGPTASGDTMITTNIYATNPAHRTIQVNVTDRIYAGADQAVLLDTASSGPVNVAAGSDDVLVLSHQFAYDGSATSFNDVATATYTDLVTGIAVPGQTMASAAATTTASGGGIANASVLVTDTESITGTGLSFSVAQPSHGAFTNYTADASTTGPVDWEHTATASGSVTFVKTVTVDEPRVTSGSLSDTATIVGDSETTLGSDSESVAITTDAEVSLAINKTIPAGALRSGESVTFNFDVTGPDEDAASITFNFGDPLTKSTVLSGLAPGEYTVSEQPQANWADHVDQSTTITLPECDGSVAFNNSALGAGLNLIKTADADPIDAGEQASFTILIWNAGPGTALDAAFSDALPTGMSWSFELVNGDQDDACASSMSSEEQTISCQFGDLAPSSMPEAPYSAKSPGKVIRVWADTDRDDCGVITNTAFASASNDDELDSTDTIIVNCPVIVRVPTLTIDKVVDAELITITGEAGDLTASPSIVTWTLTYTLANGPVTNAVITDEIPAGFVFLDASGDGEFIDGSVTWTFATLSESGSVTFRTTVDPETISRVAPTVNVAVIDSDETEPDDGQDSVTVEVEAPPLGGNPTPTPKPKPELPDTAAGIGLNGETVSVPLELLVALFVGSLGALTLANVKARSRRR